MEEILKFLELHIKKWVREVLEEKERGASVIALSPQNIPPKGLVKIREAGQAVGLASGTIYNLVAKKKIPFHKVNGALRFDLTELDMWARKGRPEIINIGLEKLKDLHLDKK